MGAIFTTLLRRNFRFGRMCKLSGKNDRLYLRSSENLKAHGKSQQTARKQTGQCSQ